MEVTTNFPSGLWTISHTQFFNIYCYSSVMASFHTYSFVSSLRQGVLALMKWLMTEWQLENLFFFLGMCLERLVCFSTSCRVSLGRPFMPYYNISEHIHWRNWINWNNICLPLNCWRGRRYCLTVNLHLRFSGSPKGYLFLKDDIYAHLNLSLSRDVDLVCLRKFIISQKCTLSPWRV